MRFFLQTSPFPSTSVSLLRITSLHFSIHSKRSPQPPPLPDLLHLIQRVRKNPSRIKEIHALTISLGFSDNVLIVSRLLKSSDFNHALLIFDQIRDPLTFHFNTLIQSYYKSKLAFHAITFYVKMLQGEKKPNVFTYPSLIGACADLFTYSEGAQIHSHVFKMGFDSDGFVQTSLLHMYVCFGHMGSAHQIFDQIPNKNVVAWTNLVNGYSKLGDLETARRIFDSIPVKDVVAWSAMLSGYIQNKRFSEGLYIFNEMQIEGVKANESVLVSVLSACAHLGALDLGKWVHLYADRRIGLELTVNLGTSLVDMYAKCGALSYSVKVFQDLPCKNILTWNALMGGFAMYGHGKGASCLFSNMQKVGLRPDDITFLGILGALSHAGMVTEGRLFFEAMSKIFFISPMLDHYACMVDLLSRRGLLVEAMDLIKGMPMEPDPCIWGALLGGCRVHSNALLGAHVGEKLLELEPDHAGRYVLLSNIYASVGRWDEAKRVRLLMMERRAKPRAGCSSIEVGGLVHEFVVGDRTHPQTLEIHNKLEDMSKRLKMAGYIVDTKNVLYDLDEEDKEVQLWYHSERLAIAFGLISTEAGMPIRVVKNLRVCGDCHVVTKMLSKIYAREIVVRDSKRFHHFKEGLCSCMDYW